MLSVYPRGIKLILINLILEFLLLVINVRDSECQFRTGVECDEAQFYAPYVKVRRKRSGGDLVSIDRTGFIDTSVYIQAVLCINGPAVILRDLEEKIHPNETKPIPTYSHGKMEVFSHKCFGINKISPEDLLSLRNKNLPIRVTKGVRVIGIKAAGVQLVGVPGNYTTPTAGWFLQENFGHVIRPDRKVTDGSFAVIGNTEAFCLDVDNEFKVNVVSKANSDKEVCSWTIQRSDDFFDRYEKIFREGRNIGVYNWQTCPPRTATPAPPTPTTAQPPPPGVTIIHDPFAIIDPRGPTSSVNERQNLTRPFDPDGYKFKPEIELEFRVEAKVCQALPVINKTGCLAAPPIVGSDEQVELIYQALLLPPDHPKKFSEDLKWKDDVLRLIADIFNRICEPMPPHFSFTVVRILELYLINAHELDGNLRKTRHVNWDLLVGDLNLCKKHADSYIWFAWNITSTGGSSYSKKRRRRNASPRRDSSHSYEHFENYTGKSRKSDKHHHHHHNHYHHQQRDHLDDIYQPLSDHNFLSHLESDFLHSMESIPESQRAKKAATIIPRLVALELTPAAMFQEYFLPKRKHEKDFKYYPIGVRHVSKNGLLDETNIYFYEDTAEFEYDLNAAIDLAWKIWATVAGYCNQHYPTRQSETFPRFQNTFHEDFLLPLDQMWKNPTDNEVIRSIFSKFNGETGMLWLDICLEGAYIDSKTRSYRPPRPLTVVGKQKADLKVANSLLGLPSKRMQAQFDVDSIQKLHHDRVSNVPQWNPDVVLSDVPAKWKPKNKKLKRRKYKEGIRRQNKMKGKKE